MPSPPPAGLKSTLKLAVIYVWFFLFQNTQCSFLKTFPIIWTLEKDISFKTGDYSASLAIKFKTPCDDFYSTEILSESKDYFVSWCTNMTIANVVKPLEEICSPTPSSSFSAGGSWKTVKRRKGFLVKSVLGLFATGRLDYDDSNEHEQDEEGSPEEFDLLSKIIDELKQIQVQALMVTATPTTTTTAGSTSAPPGDDDDGHDVPSLQSRINDLESQIAQLTLANAQFDQKRMDTWKQALPAQLGPTVTLVSKLGAFFELSKSHLIEIARDWHAAPPPAGGGRKFNLKLLELFKLEEDRDLSAFFENTKPLQCYVDARVGLAFFEVLRQNTTLGIHALRANPFILYQAPPPPPAAAEKGKKSKSKKLEFGYQLDYVGPPQVIYDSLTDCVVPLRRPSSSAQLVLVPAGSECHVMSDQSIYKYWKKVCVPVQQRGEEEGGEGQDDEGDATLVQVKAVDDKYFIYCAGFFINIYKSIQPCPAHVFEIHMDEYFEVRTTAFLNNGSNLGYSIYEMSDFQSASSLHSNKINYHVMPKVLDVDIASFPLDGGGTDCKTAGLPGAVIASIAVGAALLLVVFVAIGVLAWYFKKNMDQLRLGGMVNVGINVNTVVAVVRHSVHVHREKRSRYDEYNPADHPDRATTTLRHNPDQSVKELVKKFETEQQQQQQRVKGYKNEQQEEESVQFLP